MKATPTVVIQQKMDVVMPPPGLAKPPGLEGYQATPPGLFFEPESEPLTRQIQIPQRPPFGPAPPPACAPLRTTGPAPPPAAHPDWVVSSQSILDVNPGQGAPLKVSLMQPFCAVTTLDRTLPAKKRVPANYGTGDAAHLDPMIPAKKKIPEFFLASPFNLLN